MRSGAVLRGLFGGVLWLALCLVSAVGSPASGAEPTTAGEEPGERMYREGLLPTGKPMQARIRGDVVVDGSSFACVSCHLRSGLGCFEGGVLTPATTGAKLYRPAFLGPAPGASPRSSRPPYFTTPPRRSAYSDQTLADAILAGVNPDGYELNPVMPRYELDREALGTLIPYLKGLSGHHSPGVDHQNIRFATVVSEDIPAHERDAMLIPLKNFMQARNNMGYVYEKRARYGAFAEEMDLAFRRPQLSVWLLKGDPASWRRQLEEHLRREPVFALLGGMVRGDWRPVHDFCEQNRVPCLFPLTDFPVVSEKDWYTLYFSRGVQQEGETAARYLARLDAPPAARQVVKVVRGGPEGRALSAGFDAAWNELGLEKVNTIEVAPGEHFGKERLQRLLAERKPAVLLLWLGGETVPLLDAATGVLGQTGMIMVSNADLAARIYDIPGQLRQKTYITYPYRLPQEEGVYARLATPLLMGKLPGNDPRRITTRAYSLIRVLQQGLMHMQRDFFRDYFLDSLDLTTDQTLPDFERLSFGPGQRYASKGCYIVQLSPAPGRALLKRSEWVIH